MIVSFFPKRGTTGQATAKSLGVCPKVEGRGVT